LAKKQKQEEVKAGAPLWMVSFSDFMSLLLTFFVLLFATAETGTDSDAVAAVLAALGNPNFGPTIAVVQPPTGAAMSSGAFTGGVISMPLPFTGSARFEPQQSDIDGSQINQLLQSVVLDFETYFINSPNPLSQNVQVELVEDEIIITFADNMIFASGSAVLIPQTLEMLDYVANVLYDHPMLNIYIHGHTDNVPISTALFPNNWFLGFARAHSVMSHFTNVHNINPARIRPQSFGEYSPVATNDTPEGRALNRRVEIIISPN